MKPIVVFGTGPIARMVKFLFTHDSPDDVVAFAVDRTHLQGGSHLGLPVVAFEDMPDLYPPDTHRMFVAVGYRRVNTFRAERYRQAKEMGYELPSYVSTRASVWPDLEIGDNCLVMDDVVIHPFVSVGNDCFLWSACHIGHESVVGDHCFISSHAVVSGLATVESNCFLGSNATIRDSVTVARSCIVGAGAVISKDTQEGGVYAAPQSRLLPITSDRLPSL